jgi:RNA polymerase sigma factor (sigma-70 family)
VREAAAGDDRAWRDLVLRMDGVLRGVARGYRLAPCDVDDVVQTTWLRAFAHVGRMNEPGAIAAWLIVTTRREAMRTLQRGVREVLTDDDTVTDDADPVTPEALAIERERRTALRGAVRRLPVHQRRLLSSMLASPSPSYQHISSRLDIPIGSIGPTRERALGRLRDDFELRRALAV